VPTLLDAVAPEHEFRLAIMPSWTWYCSDGFFRHRTQYRWYPRHCQVFILSHQLYTDEI